ncbi:MAG: hypothetical protein AUJ52_04825 [Elusimicrobia bacterium CG1_02_63_36]|nr:MAG: hypothetical protein AUJ52_04825 [Elusimicrobia bacterium CG1_02_63_36]PIP82739.1 MAG: hypothetical protein COR54_13355 [Elusimicrobia bacterium CG22_combo_CG10-13_8_21_14_all_63_91]PJA11982.1 MAG: hypothetical protein COX66_18540 [Elusimicrobia bacterium CG_4_10_14_0_2_um_filter_63_34]PJB23773.1 MAG: hypothetical protein CO113_16800 [Elusimicrobia bacterium CG_4_9_14_3_um_filter_62_55]
MNEVLTMSHKEVDKHHVIRQILDRKMTWAQGAEQLGVSERHVGRLCSKLRKNGKRGLIHSLRGKAGNRKANLELLGINDEFIDRFRKPNGAKREPPV